MKGKRVNNKKKIENKTRSFLAELTTKVQELLAANLEEELASS